MNSRYIEEHSFCVILIESKNGSVQRRPTGKMFAAGHNLVLSGAGSPRKIAEGG